MTNKQSKWWEDEFGKDFGDKCWKDNVHEDAPCNLDIIAFIAWVERETEQRVREECIASVVGLTKLRVYEDALDQVKAGAFNKAISDVLYVLRSKLPQKDEAD